MLSRLGRFVATLATLATIMGSAAFATDNRSAWQSLSDTEKRIKTSNICAAVFTITEGFYSPARSAAAQRNAELTNTTILAARASSWRKAAQLMSRMRAKLMTEQQVAEFADKCNAVYRLNLAPATSRVAEWNADGQKKFNIESAAEQKYLRAIPKEQYERPSAASANTVGKDHEALCYKIYLMWGEKADSDKMRRLYGGDLKFYGNMKTLSEADKQYIKATDGFFDGGSMSNEDISIFSEYCTRQFALKPISSLKSKIIDTAEIVNSAFSSNTVPSTPTAKDAATEQFPPGFSADNADTKASCQVIYHFWGGFGDEPNSKKMQDIYIGGEIYESIEAMSEGEKRYQEKFHELIYVTPTASILKIGGFCARLFDLKPIPDLEEGVVRAKAGIPQFEREDAARMAILRAKAKAEAQEQLDYERRLEQYNKAQAAASSTSQSSSSSPNMVPWENSVDRKYREMREERARQSAVDMRSSNEYWAQRESESRAALGAVTAYHPVSATGTTGVAGNLCSSLAEYCY